METGREKRLAATGPLSPGSSTCTLQISNILPYSDGQFPLHKQLEMHMIRHNHILPDIERLMKPGHRLEEARHHHPGLAPFGPVDIRIRMDKRSQIRDMRRLHQSDHINRPGLIIMPFATPQKIRLDRIPKPAIAHKNNQLPILKAKIAEKSEKSKRRAK
jgi:hypothetical protein